MNIGDILPSKPGVPWEWDSGVVGVGGRRNSESKEWRFPESAPSYQPRRARRTAAILLILATCLLMVLFLLGRHLGLSKALDPLKNTSSSSASQTSTLNKHALDTAGTPSLFATIYRIIGNDLPPRHSPGQTLVNLKFILEHEPDFENCRKVWILNRLLDQDKERAIMHLLDKFQKPYIRIEFDPEAYEQVSFRYEDFPGQDYFYSEEYLALPAHLRLMAIDHTYHDKNLYVMNNNGARNLALEDGQYSSRWVLPFDGNCFLTESAWHEIRRNLEIYGAQYKYFAVPMVRLTDNSVLLKKEINLDATEEPQIIFRHDAQERFNQSMRYGRRSKVELLWRLGILGHWERWKFYTWEQRVWQPSPDVGNFRKTGWVARLFSGRPNQETQGASKMRNYNRVLAIQRFIDAIDERIIRTSFSPETLLSIDSTLLSENQRRYWVGQDSIDQRVRFFLEHQRPKSTSPRSINHQLVVSQLFDTDFANSIRSLNQVLYEITWHAYAYYFTTHEEHGKISSDLISGWFLHPVNPTQLMRLVAQMRSGATDALSTSLREITDKHVLVSLLNQPTNLFNFITNATNILDGNLQAFSKTMHLHCLLDTFRRLEEGHILGRRDVAHLRAWANDMLEYLLLYLQLPSEPLPLHRRSFFDLQIAALAAYVDDAVTFSQVVDRAKMRAELVVDTIRAISERGPAFWDQLDATPANRDQLLAVQNYLILANMGARGGVSLWNQQISGMPVSYHFSSWLESVSPLAFRPDISNSVKLRILFLQFSFYGADTKSDLWTSFYGIMEEGSIDELQWMEWGMDPFWYLSK